MFGLSKKYEICPLQDVKNIDTNSKEQIGFLNFVIVICYFISVSIFIETGSINYLINTKLPFSWITFPSRSFPWAIHT